MNLFIIAKGVGSVQTAETWQQKPTGWLLSGRAIESSMADFFLIFADSAPILTLCAHLCCVGVYRGGGALPDILVVRHLVLSAGLEVGEPGSGLGGFRLHSSRHHTSQQCPVINIAIAHRDKKWAGRAADLSHL